MAGFKTYITGPPTAKTGLLQIYDIFGFFPQTIQGADIIAHSGEYLVVMPDWFQGKPLPIETFPPDTDEKKQALQSFFSGPATPPKMFERFEKVWPVLKEKFPGVERWGIMGYCFGGKIATLMSGPNTQFAFSIQVHPAMLEPSDAAQMTIPHLCIATKDEDPDTTAQYRIVLQNHLHKAVKEKSVVERWEGTFHGFMAARADLGDEGNFEYYGKGYQKVLDFMATV